VESQAAAAQAGVISRLQVRLMRAQSPAERRQLLDQLWEAEQRSKLRGAEPGTSLLVGGNRATARTLQRTLARNELVLEYVLSDPESYCLVISRSGIRLAKLASRARVETLVDRFTQDLRSGKGNATGVAKELHEAVLMPIKEWRTAQRLLVVPDPINWLASTSCPKRSSTRSGWQFGSSCCTVIARSASSPRGWDRSHSTAGSSCSSMSIR
jgi:hypothetical protein